MEEGMRTRYEWQESCGPIWQQAFPLSTQWLHHEQDAAGFGGPAHVGMDAGWFTHILSFGALGVVVYDLNQYAVVACLLEKYTHHFYIFCSFEYDMRSEMGGQLKKDHFNHL